MRNVVAVLLALAAGSTVFAASKSEQAAFAAVKGFYEAANHSECDKAEAFFSDDSVKQLTESLGGAGGFSAFCLDRGGKAPLTAVQLLKAEVKKGAAEVSVERAYGDGSKVVETEHLVNEKGAWKLVFSAKKP